MFGNLFSAFPLLSFMPFFLCWDDGAAGGGGGGAAGGAAGAGAVGGAATGDEKKYTDADLNRVLADDRKRNAGSATAAQKQAQAMQTQLQAILDGKDLPEGSPIRQQIDDLHSSLAGEKAAAEKAQTKLAKDLKAAQDAALANDGKYKKLKVGRSLLDAALPVAVRPSAADIIAGILEKSAGLDDKENVYVELNVTADGITEAKKLSPMDAVKYMETQVDLYGMLFTSGAAAGVGGKNDAAKTAAGEIDYSKLSFEQLKKLAAEDPTKLGLSKAVKI